MFLGPSGRAGSSSTNIQSYKVGMSYIKRKVLTSTLQNPCFRVHQGGWGGGRVIKCKNPNFLEGRHVIYHMKGLDE